MKSRSNDNARHRSILKYEPAYAYAKSGILGPSSRILMCMYILKCTGLGWEMMAKLKKGNNQTRTEEALLIMN